MNEPSEIIESLQEAARALGVLSEQIGEQIYGVVTSETLKDAAIAAGVDHTRDPAWVIRQLFDAGRAAERERWERALDRFGWLSHDARQTIRTAIESGEDTTDG